MGKSLCARLQILDDHQAKAEMILALPKRSVLASANSQCLLTLLRPETDPLLQFATARTLSRADGVGAADHVVPVLLRLVRDAKPLVQVYKLIATRGYDAVDEISICLCLVGSQQAPNILPVLLDVLDGYTGFNAAMIAHTLLCLAFDNTPQAPGTTFGDLTSEQQQVLLRIGTSTRAWRYAGNMAETLAFYGLPNTKEALDEFCVIER